MAPPKENVSPPKTSLFEIFFTKLKDQSFTIILMIGILYYQNMMWNKDHQELESKITEVEKEVKDCNARERALYAEKGEALRKQREEFLTTLKQINFCSPNTYFIPQMMTKIADKILPSQDDKQ